MIFKFNSNSRPFYIMKSICKLTPMDFDVIRLTFDKIKEETDGVVDKLHLIDKINVT